LHDLKHPREAAAQKGNGVKKRKRGRKRVWILDIDKVRRFLISVKYHAVSKLLKRFETRLRSDAELKAVLSEIHGRLNV
jgi:hypothetical protein